jgi:hypothetical protein
MLDRLRQLFLRRLAQRRQQEILAIAGTLLRAQADESEEAAKQLRELFRSAELEPGTPLFAVASEWEAMFSFPGGRKEGVPLIQRLVRWIADHPRGSSAALYDLPEWAELVKLRGPVDTIEEMRDPATGEVFVVLGISGFLDINGFVCESCGDVYFKSRYNDAPVPRCACGAEFPSIASSAGQFDVPLHPMEPVREFSPYEYFAHHSYHWDQSE